MSWELPHLVHSPATAPPKASMPQVHLELQILHHSKAPKSIGTSGSEEARPEREDLAFRNHRETTHCRIASIVVAIFLS